MTKREKLLRDIRGAGYEPLYRRPDRPIVGNGRPWWLEWARKPHGDSYRYISGLGKTRGSALELLMLRANAMRTLGLHGGRSDEA